MTLLHFQLTFLSTHCLSLFFSLSGIFVFVSEPKWKHLKGINTAVASTNELKTRSIAVDCATFVRHEEGKKRQCNIDEGEREEM